METDPDCDEFSAGYAEGYKDGWDDATGHEFVASPRPYFRRFFLFGWWFCLRWHKSDIVYWDFDRKEGKR